MSLLNLDLKEQIQSHLTGRILLNIEFYEKTFDIEFLSTLSCLFVKKPYSIDENIIFED